MDLTDGGINNGREAIYNVKTIQQEIKKLPIRDRGTWERVAFKLDVSKTTLLRYKKQG